MKAGVLVVGLVLVGLVMPAQGHGGGGGHGGGHLGGGHGGGHFGGHGFHLGGRHGRGGRGGFWRGGRSSGLVMRGRSSVPRITTFAGFGSANL